MNKKERVEYMRALGSKGGKQTARKGKKYMRDLGRKGGLAKWKDIMSN